MFNKRKLLSRAMHTVPYKLTVIIVVVVVLVIIIIIIIISIFIKSDIKFLHLVYPTS